MIYLGKLLYDPNVYFTFEGELAVSITLSTGQSVEFLDPKEKMIPYIELDALQAGDEIAIWGEMSYPRNSRRAVIKASALGFYYGQTSVKVSNVHEPRAD